jgi:hypothetical protein
MHGGSYESACCLSTDEIIYWFQTWNVDNTHIAQALDHIGHQFNDSLCAGAPELASMYSE